ncbi:glycine/D-amino acid oxidase-like deaminating enzyme [Stella humosa]|uniref:Glycine/D-amino acid oxidase-like deaminating enzyme n=1 Tax=Stella humosa TaxID=94 RepID=A0A3N1LIF2_9PROT|nr:FAD-dependent oxidoreductase [Stella humosa]ROP90619.1 glycine/D-amino acid oxidase-like deaminating enzyme [Stella humosa]BBK29485.1 oxidoreductase [Stella humosa]
MFEPETTAQPDLRGGVAPWHAGVTLPEMRPPTADLRCGVLIVGAGITGSLMAEHLTRMGLDVVVIDRERPGFGSTAASTAMLQWEIDTPLGKLADLYGFERAARIYQRSYAAARGLCGVIDELGLGCQLRQRQSVYLAAGDVGARDLLAEHELRTRAGLPGDFLDYRLLRQSFGFDREAAIVAPGSADADPLRLSLLLLETATRRGAKLLAADAVAWNSGLSSVTVGCADGRTIEADHVVLATGYVMPDFVPAGLHRLASSWAVATPVQRPDALWPERALVWEASETYAYARTTDDGRIVIGGEDDPDLIEPDARDQAMPDKARTLLAKLHTLWPPAVATADYVWSGVFGSTVDGLPLIGTVPDRPRIHAAYGYGGNGITFSFLASRMIHRLIAGGREDWFSDFAIDRSVP